MGEGSKGGVRNGILRWRYLIFCGMPCFLMYTLIYVIPHKEEALSILS